MALNNLLAALFLQTAPINHHIFVKRSENCQDEWNESSWYLSSSYQPISFTLDSTVHEYA